MKIGQKEIEYPVFLAPMAGVTDRAFRSLCRETGADYTFTEMISAKAVHFRDRKTALLCSFGKEETPLSVQIFGSDPDTMGECAEKISNNTVFGCVNSRRPDGIDINMGCPVKKVAGNGDGSALMKDPALAESVISAVVKATDLPVSVKIRSGWDASHINAVEIALRAEKAGAAFVTVHGRTREQMYGGKADRKVIAEVKRALSIPVIGNGDIASGEDALRFFEETKCDGIMVGRAACGNPFLFAEIASALRGEPYRKPSKEERIRMAKEQLHRMVLFKGEEGAVCEARKHMAWYLRGMRGASAVRGRINEVKTEEEMLLLLDSVVKGGEESGE